MPIGELHPSALNIWIFNPFDELPGDTDIRHRYWSLAATLADRGHAVTWWSSDWSHRTKSRRDARPAPVGFAIRRIPTPPYFRNVSLARLRNHRAYARGLCTIAHRETATGTIPPPDRIVCSLPPLGSPLAALELRATFGCEVILDYMDAWPETFYRVIPCPTWVKAVVGRILFAPLHRSARRAIKGVDRISAVSEIYLGLARSIAPRTPTHLCYHGIDLQQSLSGSNPGCSAGAATMRGLRPDGAADGEFRIVYIGALERTYDLTTAIRAIGDINVAAGRSQRVALHIAGAGAQEAAVRAAASSRPWLHFHGLLQRDELQALLSRCHAGLIPMQQNSWVGLPYKVADYCAAGLAVISSLDGECRRLLNTNRAGLWYEPGSVESLKSQIESLSANPNFASVMGRNAFALAKSAFDRAAIYPQLAEFILGDSPSTPACA